MFAGRFVLLYLFDIAVIPGAFVSDFFETGWTRNADSIHKIVSAYKSKLFQGFFYYDIALLQILASNMDPVYFLRLLFLHYCLPNAEKQSLRHFSCDSKDFYTEVVINSKAKMLKHMLSTLYNVLTERHVCAKGGSGNKFELLKTHIIHLLASGSMTRTQLIYNITHFQIHFVGKNSVEFNSMVDEILSQVSNFRHGAAFDRAYFLKEDLFDHVDRFYCCYSRSESSMAYVQIEMRHKKGKGSPKPKIPIPLAQEFSGIKALIISDELLDMMISILNSMNFEIGLTVTNTVLELVLLIIFQIVSVHVELHDNHVINAPPLKLFTQKISGLLLCEFLGSILASSIDPITRSLADFIKTTFANFESRFYCSDVTMSPPPVVGDEQNQAVGCVDNRHHAGKEKLAELSRAAALANIASQDEKFKMYNTDWLNYKEDSKEDSACDLSSSQIHGVVAQVCVGPKRQQSLRTIILPDDTRLACVMCNEIHTVAIPKGNKFFYELQTQFAVLCKQVLSRRMEDMSQNANSSVANGKIRFLQLWKREDRAKRELFITGCGHLTHISCIPMPFKLIYSRKDEKLPFQNRISCRLCTLRNSILLPFYHPVVLDDDVNPLISERLPIRTFVTEVFELLKELNKNINLDTNFWLRQFADSVFPVESLFVQENKNGQDVDLSPTSDKWFCDSKDPHPSLFVKVFMPSHYFTELTEVGVEPNGERFYATLFLSPIVSSHRTLVHTISCLELNNRLANPTHSLFNHSLIESLTFKVCTQLARFCYYGSGIGFLFEPKNDLMKSYTQAVYAQFMLYTCRAVIGQVADGSWCNNLDAFLSTNMFEVFAELYLGLSVISIIDQMSIQSIWQNPLCLDKYCLRFCFIIRTVQIIILFLKAYELNDSETIADENPKSVTFLSSLFLLVTKYCPAVSGAVHSSCFYGYWVVKVLPFLRRSALLLYQLTSVSPPKSLISNISLPPEDEVKALLQYLDLSVEIEDDIDLNDLKLIEIFLVNYLPSLACHEVHTEKMGFIERPISLIKPPHAFIDLVAASTKVKCAKCKHDPLSSWFCLYCGKWVASDRCCNNSQADPNSDEESISPLIGHLSTCGLEDGIFLKLNPPRTLYACNDDAVPIPYPLYEDEHGESMLTSSNPLFFSQTYYDRLNYLYQNSILRIMKFDVDM